MERFGRRLTRTPLGIAALSGLAVALGASTSIERKFASIESERLPPGSRVVITRAEWNAWLPTVLPGTVRQVHVDLGSGRVTVSALVNFLPALSSLIDGERPVVATARIQSAHGQARVDFERVTAAGLPVDPRIIDFLIRDYFTPGRWFPLEHHMERFEITPSAVTVIIRSVAELRREALAATPPAESGDFRAPDLVEPSRLDPAIHLDIRYATANNFMHVPMYTSPRAYLQRPAAGALVRVSQALKAQGYGLLIYDGYRPWFVTKMFWEAVAEENHKFVADPSQGSRHNRGCAVDLSLYSLRTGRPLTMPSGYDEMTDRAYPTYTGGAETERTHRETLRRAMEREGFTVYETEWWHFDYKDWPHYPIGNWAWGQ